MAKKQEKKDEKGEAKRRNDTIQKAVDRGIHYLQRDNPGLSSFEGYLNKYIDKYALSDKINHFTEDVYNDKNLSKHEKEGYVAHSITSYVASGGMLTEEGKEKILTGKLEEMAKEDFGKGFKGFFKSLLHRPKIDGEKYLHDTFEAFEDLAALMESGNYARDNPELAESLGTLKKLKFSNAAIEVLKDGGIIDPKGYKRLKGQVLSKAEEGRTEVPKTIERYLIPEMVSQKAAAGILTFLGFGLILGTSPGITGNSIALGSLFSSTVSLIGLGVLVLGLILLLLSKKKKTNRRKKKSK